MSVRRFHDGGTRPHGATFIPLPHVEDSLGPSATHTPQVENPSLTIPYSAPMSIARRRMSARTPSYSNSVTSSVHSRSSTSRSRGNASQQTGLSSLGSSRPRSVTSSWPNDLDPSTTATNSILRCNICLTEFTGYYRRGNLARHARHKHAHANMVPYKCSANGCLRIFARSDARLKHERKQHPRIHPEPIQRRCYNNVSHREGTVDETSAMTGPVRHTGLSTIPTVPMYQPIEYLRGRFSHNTLSQYRPGWEQPTPYEPSHDSNTSYYTASAMSTQSSSQGFNNNGSSQYHLSPQTGPSSVLGSVDNMLLSPHIPAYPFSHASRTSDTCSHTIHQGIEPDYQALPEAYPSSDDPRYLPTPMPRYIDPSVLLQQGDGFGPPKDGFEEYEDDDLRLPNNSFEEYKEDDR